MRYFIAYSRMDSKAMKTIRSELESSDHTVNTDEDIPRNASDWQEYIEEFIENSDEMIVLLSPSAKRSPAVRREIEYAKSQEISIIAILIRGDKKASIPLSLSGCQYEDRRAEFDQK